MMIGDSIVDIEQLIPCKSHIITIPSKILRQMPFHQRTVETLEEFDKAWEEFLKAEKGVKNEF